MIRKLFAALVVSVAFVAGCSSDDSNCVNKSECFNGQCKCTDGANKDKPCCDPSDSSCANSPTKCDVYCKTCS